MKIKLMRFIDYYVGIPLCFMFSIVHFILKSLFFGIKPDVDSKKILIIKLSEMGSVILSYPLLNAIKLKYPSAELFFLTFCKNKPIAEILNVVPKNNILTIRDDSFLKLAVDAVKVLKNIRRERIDIVFDLELFSRFTSILSYLSGAIKKVGFYRYYVEGLYRGSFLTHRVQYNPTLHISRSFLSLLQGVGLKTKINPTQEEKIEDINIYLPRFFSSQEKEKQIWGKLKELDPTLNNEFRFILIHPGEGSLPLREWPLINFTVLIDKVLKDSKNYIIIVGAKDAHKNAEFLCKSANNNRCLNLTGKTDIEEILALCNIGNLLIANDSGLAHIASLTPIKNFVLFGPESPRIYSPLGENTSIIYANLPCSPCFSAFNHRQSACQDNRCLKNISVDEVYDLMKREL